MLFKDVIGQQSVKQHLIEMVQHNRLSHALLFLGKEGSGGLPLAMAFAQYIACLPADTQQTSGEASLFGEPVEVKLPATPEAADDWMQKQPSFSKANGLVHPDIHFSYPVIKRDSKHDKPISTDYIVQWRDFLKQMPYGNEKEWVEFIKQHPHDRIDNPANKQGNITAEECNDIIRKLSLKSFESGYKTLVMWMPEYLGKEGNKLLKLIEEPPPNTLFILVAESESSILSTILSRCQLIRLPPIASADLEAALIQRSECPPEKARLLANASEGNYREALHLMQHADEDFHSLLKEWLNTTLKYQVAGQLKCIEELARLGREKQKQFLRHFIHLIEQAVRLQVADEGLLQHMKTALSDGEWDFANRINKVMNLEQKEAVSEELNKASYHIERNANAKILFHALTIKIFHIVRSGVVVSV